MVNAAKADQVEMMLIQMAQQGKIKEKISESKIVSLLEQGNEAQGSMTVERVGKRADDLAGSQWDDGGEDPMAKAMAMGARIPGKGGDDSDDY